MTKLRAFVTAPVISVLIGCAAFSGDAAAAWAVAAEPLGPSSRRTPLVISEIMYHPQVRPDGRNLEFLEIYNSQPWFFDLSGFRITGDAEFVFPPNTILPGQSFLLVAKAPADMQVVYQATNIAGAFSGQLPNSSGMVRLEHRNGGVLLEVRYSDANPWPLSADGAGHSLVLTRPSLGERNPAAWSVSQVSGGSPGVAEPEDSSAVRGLVIKEVDAGESQGASGFNPRVVINEIMYAPLSGDSADEYIELHNWGSMPVSLAGWRLVDGVEFEFPDGALIGSGGFVVVAKDAERLRSRNPNLDAGSVLGPYKGTLSNGGERVALVCPEGTSVRGIDEVTYATGGKWPVWADGGGSSLELIDPRGDRQSPANWAASDESAKAPWTCIEYTGELHNFATPIPGGAAALHCLHVLLLDSGECLLDNVEVLRDGVNLVANPAFEEGLAKWAGQGTHQWISLEPSGHESAASLRLLATGRGDPGPNRLLTRLTQSLVPRQTVTLRAHARWLRGSPEMLLRLVGNYAEAYGRLTTPANCGTPGAPNSQARPNTGPGISKLQHAPILPAANEPITISAHVQDPDGISSVLLRYRLDPATNVVEVPMRDDGLDEDLSAGDGIFTTQIAGQASPTLIAFCIVAADAASSPAISLYPADAPARECLVRVGDPQIESQFGVYRIWMTRRTLDRWRQREVTSNDPLNVTFVYGKSRVIHNVGAYYAGSKFAANYDSPTGSPCDYTLLFPDDDRLLGATDFRISWPGNLNAGPDQTAQGEQAAYWLAEQLGLPFNYRRYVICYVNGVRRNTVMEDTQRPNGDYLEQWFPKNPDGDLYKIQVHYETDEAARSFWAARRAGLVPVNLPPEIGRTVHYRWNWAKRAVNGSANDFQELFTLVDTANLPDDQRYAERMEALVDVEQWMRVFAVEHIVGNWDSFGYADGSNMYFFKPIDGRWRLCIWDMDMQMGTFADPPTTSIFAQSSAIFPSLVSDQTTQRFFSHPKFRRAYLRALKQAVDGPLLSVGALLDAKAAAFATNRISVTSPATIKSYLASRRNSINNQLSKLTVPFALRTPSEVSSETAVVNLEGTAPFEIEAIHVNGAKYPIQWASITNWSLQVPLTAPVARLQIEGFAADGSPVPGTFSTVTVTYAGSAPLPRTQLFINEWMASNTKTVADPADGDFEDWFEIYNPGPAAVDLGGWQLSDDPANPSKFVIPLGWTLPAGGFLLVWADEERSQNAAGTHLHVNFKLSKSGEELLLTAPDGTRIDSVKFGAQKDDVSEGRLPDGGIQIASTAAPSPGARNIAATPESGVACRAARFAPGQVSILWEATPGRTYQVQYQDALGNSMWQPLLELTANATTASTVVPSTPRQQRFFRVINGR